MCKGDNHKVHVLISLSQQGLIRDCLIMHFKNELKLLTFS